MNEIDAALAELGRQAAPARLNAIDGAVFDGLSAYRERDVSRRALVLAGFVAGFVGLGFGLGSGSPASAEPLLGVPASAPSHLLADG